jgi:hypothetical protein
MGQGRGSGAWLTDRGVELLGAVTFVDDLAEDLPAVQSTFLLDVSVCMPHVEPHSPKEG